MRREDLHEEDYTGGEQPCFVIERSIDELPSFQSSIYRCFSPIEVKERVITDDISYRLYYGNCEECGGYYLGTLITCCDEPLKLFSRINRVGI